MLQGDTCYAFWNRSIYADQASNVLHRIRTKDPDASSASLADSNRNSVETGSADEGGHLRAGDGGRTARPSSRLSAVSTLSSDTDGVSVDGGGDEDDGVKCPKCGGESFRARRERGGKSALECVGCGTLS